MRPNTYIYGSFAEWREAINKFGDQTSGPPVLGLSVASNLSQSTVKVKREGNWHRHLRGQVICIEEELVHARTERGSWIVPPNQAMWIPPGHAHQGVMTEAPYAWTLYLAPSIARVLPDEPCIISINELLHSLVDRAIQWSNQTRLQPAQRRQMMVLIDELRAAPRVHKHLPMPTDRRLQRIANAFLADPTNMQTREEWASWAGLSTRTLTRHFKEEVKMSFQHWREQAVLMAALDRLSKGESVASVSDALGYSAPSSFIAMFRRHFGVSPGRYTARGRLP